MRRLTFAMNVSLDGYVSTTDGDLGWGTPSDELFQFWSDRLASTGLSLHGRRLWQDMSGHWPTADQAPDVTAAHAEYAERWRAVPKVVFASQPVDLGWNARLVTTDAVAEIRRLKAEDGGPMDVGGATLAAAAMRAGLVDEYVLLTVPVILGGGRPFFATLDDQVSLELVETRSFSGGVLLTRYAVAS